MGSVRSRPGGLDGRSLRAHQWDVTRKRSIVMALALAVAVTPALAAERGARAAPRMAERRTEPPAPPTTSPFRGVLQTLERLRGCRRGSWCAPGPAPAPRS